MTSLNTTVLDEEKVEKIRKRVALEEKAHRIVVQLTDTTPNENDLHALLQFISTEHYDDIVEERSVCKLCGYPLCANIPNNDMKQKYWISTRTKTVYDLSERKKYCSNHCMAASQHLRKQISSSPVWLRDNEAPVNVNFLPKTDKCGVPGKVVVTRMTRYADIACEVQQLEMLDTIHIQSADSDGKSEKNPTKSNVCSSDKSESEGELEQDCPETADHLSGACFLPDWQEDFERELMRRMKADVVQTKHETSKEVTRHNSSTPNKTSNVPEEKLKNVLELLAKKRKGLVKTCLIDVPWNAPSDPKVGTKNVGSSSMTVSNSTRSAEKRTLSPVTNCFISSVHPLEQTQNKLKTVLLEWRTLETVRLMTSCEDIHLPERVSVINQTSAEAPENYVDMEEARSLKGRPSFKKLRFEEAEKSQMKVDAEQYGVKVNRFLGENQQSANQVDDYEIVLPPVHSCSQMSLRRKIVLDKLSGVLPVIIGKTSLSMTAVSTSVRQLVCTFNLTSHNILLSHDDWTAVGIIILKVLSTRDVSLNEQLNTDTSSKFADASLASIQLNDSDIEEIISWMTRLSDEEKRDLNLGSDCSNAQLSHIDRDAEVEFIVDEPYDALD